MWAWFTKTFRTTLTDMRAARRKCFSTRAMASSFEALTGLGKLVITNTISGMTPAKSLLDMVLTTYAENHDGPPNELFIHGQTNFNDEEWKAFEEAAPATTNVVGVRIKTTGGRNQAISRWGLSRLTRYSDASR